VGGMVSALPAPTGQGKPAFLRSGQNSQRSTNGPSRSVQISHPAPLSRTWSCPLCRTVTTVRNELLSHMTRRHENAHICPSCLTAYESQDELNSHAAGTH
ncbi:hypothetical protein JB92DRAFT_3009517, partial [Gautieria morchelliformis]